MEDFKVKVKDENLWVDEKNLENIPDIIKKEYSYLKECVYKGDICGTLFRLKDIYEISMKVSTIIAITYMNSYMEKDNVFVRMTDEQLQKEHAEFINDEASVNEESEELKEFKKILSRLLREPLAMGSWRELSEKIVNCSGFFELDKNLLNILIRTNELFKVHPRKVNGEKGKYDNVENWRNKTIGHGTLLINTEMYWGQAYDLIKALQMYLMGKENERPLSFFYNNIFISQKQGDNSYIVQVGEKNYPVSEYIYNFDDDNYFFDSYYSRQRYTEVTNYLSTPKRLKQNTYYQSLFSLVSEVKKSSRKKKGRQITNNIDREMYACLNSIARYENPVFIIEKIKKFMNENKKGVMYIQMERGMGKSTLAHGLDGRYQKDILQKDLAAVVRVYHISDMRLRGEDKTRDFFTALNTNLTSYAGKQLEMDDEEYYYEDKDLRQVIKQENEEAQVAFAQYLELFRYRYEDELYGEEDGEEINIVYIIDGIDELNSDTERILNAIPSHEVLKSISDEIADHIYIIMLSRTKEEENLPEVAIKSMAISEQKAGSIFKIDGKNEEYCTLLKKYILRNYKEISEEKVEEIINCAQRKFLYIEPYMALGKKVLKSDEKITAYEVAKNYMEELQKLYCGVSLHTLQLIVASIAMFHTVSLKEICELVLFTDVSYDVIGILNDILPLLTTRRTEDEDIYEFANEEYEKYIIDKFYDSVYEGISRFRISLVSWFENVDEKDQEYEKQWENFVAKLLHVDNIAKEIGLLETSEEYIKSLISLQYEKNLGTCYSHIVREQLEIDIIVQLENLKCRDLTILTLNDLRKIALEFRSPEYCSTTLDKKRMEYDKFRMISATKENVSTFNISKIQACQFGEKYDKLKIKSDLHDKRTVELLLKDERQALDRVMIQFSIYEKVTERIEENLYKFRLTYEAEDETDIMIRILSFGPNLKVLGPETFVDQIKNRLKVQKRCGR